MGEASPARCIGVPVSTLSARSGLGWNNDPTVSDEWINHVQDDDCVLDIFLTGS